MIRINNTVNISTKPVIILIASIRIIYIKFFKIHEIFHTLWEWTRKIGILDTNALEFRKVSNAFRKFFHITIVIPSIIIDAYGFKIFEFSETFRKNAIGWR